MLRRAGVQFQGGGPRSLPQEARAPAAQEAAQWRFERSLATRLPRDCGCVSSRVSVRALLAPACPRRPPLLPALGNSGTRVERCGGSGHPATLGQEGGGLGCSPGNLFGPRRQVSVSPPTGQLSPSGSPCHSAWAALMDGADSHLPGGGGCRKSEEVI